MLGCLFYRYLLKISECGISPRTTMIRCLVAIALILSMSSCMVPKYSEEYHDRVMMDFDTEEFSQVIWDFATELKYERHLRFEDSYVCFGPETKIRLEFSSQDLLEMCDARLLLVDVVEGLLDRLNHSKAVASKLIPFPLTADYLEIYIDFQSFHGVYVDPYFIGWVVLEEGTAYYYAFTLKNRDLDMWDFRYEPYFKSRSFAMLQREAEKKYREVHPISKHAPGTSIEERLKNPLH